METEVAAGGEGGGRHVWNDRRMVVKAAAPSWVGVIVVIELEMAWGGVSKS